MRWLEGLEVVLTGAAGGIGSLVAKALAERGARVLGIDRVPCPACAESLGADLADPHGLGTVAAQLERRHVDVLLNLAGIQYFGPFGQQEAKAIALGYAVNLTAPSVLARAVLPQMLARDAGQIINVGSVFGAIPFAHFVTYSAAKAGLKAFSEALRRELADTGVRVTHVAPRAVRTPFNGARVMQLAELTGMTLDAPELVATRIASLVGEPVTNLVIGFPESIFVRLNAIAPSLVDRALRGNDRKAAALFDKVEQGT